MSSVPQENNLKQGLRRKWQATVKKRGEPPEVSIKDAEKQWNEQWKKLWRDIGMKYVHCANFLFFIWLPVTCDIRSFRLHPGYLLHLLNPLH